MAHINRLDTRWLQRIEVTMPLSGTSWIALTHAESCHPATSADAEKLARIAAGTATDADRKVAFVRYGVEARQPDFAAWEECGCKISFFRETFDEDDGEYASTQQFLRAKRWAAKASAGDLVRMAQFYPHIEDASYEAAQSEAARARLTSGWCPVRTGEGVITATDLDRLKMLARVRAGHATFPDATSKLFDAGIALLIGELLAARVFVIHDDRARDKDGFAIDAS